MKRHAPVCLKLHSVPPCYGGWWSADRLRSSPFLTSLYRVRAGKPYRVTGFPLDTIPPTWYGKRLQAGSPWVLITEKPYSVADTLHFTFTPGPCLFYRGVSYPLRFTLTSWTEINLERAFGPC